MSDPQIALVMLGLFIALVFLGFPIAFTLMAMGIGFGYYAYFDAGRMWRGFNRLAEDAGMSDQVSLWIEGLFNNRIFDLFINQTYTVMSNEVLTAVPLFLFMGYVVERANIVSRLFSTLNIASRNLPGSMGVAALITCALFATATGIVGAVVTLMGLLALPAMLKARYDNSFASGIICAGGTLGILIPPSIMLIVYAASSGVSIVRLYAAALLPGLTLVGLYLVYIVGRSIIQPSVAHSGRGAACAQRPAGDHAVDLVPATGAVDPVGTGFHSVRSGNADRGGCYRRTGWHVAGGHLSSHDFPAHARIGLPDRANHSDGVLAVCRLLYLLVRFFLPGWRTGDCRFRDRTRPDTAAIFVDGAADHLSARLATGMVRDHHHLRADFPAIAANVRYRSAVFRHTGCAESANLLFNPSDGHVGVLPEGDSTALDTAHRHIQGSAAIPVHGHCVHGIDVHVSTDRIPFA